MTAVRIETIDRDKTRPVDSLRVGETLPEPYQEVINAIREKSASTQFAKQAEVIVYCFYALENNLKLYTPNGTQLKIESLAHLLGSMPWVVRMYRQTEPDASLLSKTETSIIRKVRQISLGNPETSFPLWLQEAHAHRPQRETRTPIISEFYKSYALKYQERKEQRSNGLYAIYPADFCPKTGTTEDAHFKAYVEIDATGEQLEKVFANLRSRKLHPNSSKLFEGRLVLYWNSAADKELVTQITSIFRDNMVMLRGPGIDSLYYVRDEQGKKKIEVKVSNDKALGEGGTHIDFAQTKYDPIRFLKNYLNLCYRYWRNPLNPYQLSFIPAFDKTGGDPQELVRDDYLFTQQLVPLRYQVLTLFRFDG